LVRPLELEIELLIANAVEEALRRGTGVRNRRNTRLDAVPAHEAGHSVLANPMPAPAQDFVHPRTSIGATALGMHRADGRSKTFIVALTLATLARAPRIKACPRYPIEPAHHRHAVLCPVYFDEFEDFRFRPETVRSSLVLPLPQHTSSR
jgi:hypothetical protein